MVLISHKRETGGMSQLQHPEMDSCDQTVDMETQRIQRLLSEMSDTDRAIPFSSVPHSIRNKLAVLLEPYGSWKNLAEELNYLPQEIDYFDTRKDRTISMLSDHSTKPEGRVENVLRALFKIKRYDAFDVLFNALHGCSNSSAGSYHLAAVLTPSSGSHMVYTDLVNVTQTHRITQNNPSMTVSSYSGRELTHPSNTSAHSEYLSLLGQPDRPPGSVAKDLDTVSSWSVSANTDDQSLYKADVEMDCDADQAVRREPPVLLEYGLTRQYQQPTLNAYIRAVDDADDHMGHMDVTDTKTDYSRHRSDVEFSSVPTDLRIGGQPYMDPTLEIKQEYVDHTRDPFTKNVKTESLEVAQDYSLASARWQTDNTSVPIVNHENQHSQGNRRSVISHSQHATQNSFNNTSNSSDNDTGSCNSSRCIQMNVKHKRQTYPRTKHDNREDEPEAGITRSLSVQSSLQTAPFKRGSREVRVFLTYANDNDKHMRRVLLLGDCLCKNKFSISLDESEKTLVKGRDAAKDWMKTRYTTADFVLVCISPKYESDIRPFSQAENNIRSHRLNTRFIYEMIESEMRRADAQPHRIIPLVFTRSGSTKHHVPPIFHGMLRYLWPDHYRHLFFHLMKPDELIMKLKKKGYMTDKPGGGTSKDGGAGH